ncbi:MAG: cyclodeaminase/cyclohydrolase family protein [Pyramidobacter sp.]|jgi:glutamate formiminotransferase/formiminotetrahydrofolate cyclodeaminase
MELHKMSLPDFTAELASGSPAPGGGSVAALGGALAAGLASMVGELTRGREKYAAVQGDMEQLCVRGKELARQLLELIDKDTAAFAAYLAALKLPKETEEDKSVRRAAMQAAAKKTVEVPLHTLELCAEAGELALTAISEGNANAVSDAAAAGQFAHAAAVSAAYNVRINLPGVKDPAFVSEKLAACRAALERSGRTLGRIEEAIESALKA